MRNSHCARREVDCFFLSNKNDSRHLLRSLPPLTKDKHQTIYNFLPTRSGHISDSASVVTFPIPSHVSQLRIWANFPRRNSELGWDFNSNWSRNLTLEPATRMLTSGYAQPEVAGWAGRYFSIEARLNRQPMAIDMTPISLRRQSSGLRWLAEDITNYLTRWPLAGHWKIGQWTTKILAIFVTSACIAHRILFRLIHVVHVLGADWIDRSRINYTCYFRPYRLPTAVCSRAIERHSTWWDVPQFGPSDGGRLFQISIPDI